MVVEQCADRRELIILCLEHEFEILNVQGMTEETCDDRVHACPGSESTDP